MHDHPASAAVEYSPFLKQLLSRHPQWFKQLESSGRLVDDSPPVSAPLDADVEKYGLDVGLRKFRNREMMRIIWRDLGGVATVDQSLSDLSTLADICIRTAVTSHAETLEGQHGRPRGTGGNAVQLVVIGLGKLGGNELNMSSDVDIILCYPEGGVCDGRRGLSNEQFFTRLARKVIRSLSEVTADGFCFRVDTRLRPFGASGPLVSSFSALEQYYQREGRDWERYAMIKARPVAGDLTQGNNLLAELRPFVYRRYIDFGAIDAMHEMHENVRADALRQDRLDDIKRGPGGIREIEFLVQAFQLLRGGREPSLQTPSLVRAAAALENLRLMPPERVEKLVSAYRFLRKTENCIQALHDQQTHLVPAGEDGVRVANAMGFDDFASFQSCLNATREAVQGMFEQSLPQVPVTSAATNPWLARWKNARDNPLDGTQCLPNPTPVFDFIKRLGRLSLSQRASRRLDQFMPALLEKLEAISADDIVANRVFDLISAICRRSAYLSLLVQNPGATDRMLELFSTSKQVAATVTRYPALLDELIDPRLGAFPPGCSEMQAGVQRIMRANADTEQTLQHLNYLKRAMSLRISVAVLQSTLPVFESQHAISQLAQCLIGATLSLSKLEVESRHGRLPGPGLAVIAYGSLGARALRFDSDLDLIFLYEPTREESDGARPIPAERYHTNVARRMLSLLSATTPAGRLYSIDARLRPNGKSGLLVSSVDAFSRYQHEKAWVWELQALTRARFIAGNPGISDRFEQIRQDVLATRRDHDTLIREVSNMRARVRQQNADGDPLKHSPGGLLDIEFIAQLGVLLNAADHAETAASTVVGEQLLALRDCGWLTPENHGMLDDAHARLSHARQRSTLVDDTKINLSDLLETTAAYCRAMLYPRDDVSMG